MARFNTALTSASITGTATIGSPNAGSFTNLTGTAPYTVTVPNPQLHPGVNQVFYNATSGTVTLTTPSGNFNGTGGNGTASISVFAGNVVSITSDGTHYIVISEDGSALTATTGSFSGNVTMNGSGATVSITPSTLTVAPTGASTIDSVAIGSTTRAAGAFTSLAANAAVTLTANTASSSTGTGTLVVTGGIGASGQVTATAISATNLTGTIQTAAQPNITSHGTLTGLAVSGSVGIGTSASATALIRAFAPDTLANVLHLSNTNSSVGSGTYRGLLIDGTHPNNATQYYGIQLQPSQATTAPMTGIDMSWSQVYSEGRGVNISLSKNTHAGGGDGYGIFASTISTGVNDYTYQAIGGMFKVSSGAGALDPYPHWPAKFWNASAHASNATNLLSFGTEASYTQRGFVYYDRTNTALGIAGTNALSFNTNGTVRMIINSSGNVGIGITNPVSILHVKTGGTAFTTPTMNAIGGGTSSRVHFIGTEPGLMLSSDLNSSNAAATGTGTISLGLQIGYYGANDVRSQVYWAGTPLTFTYGSSPTASPEERMRITPSGGLAIGVTTDPGAKNIMLSGNSGTIFANSVASSRSYIEMYNNSTGDMSLGTTYSTASIKFLTGGTTTPTERMRITSDGNVSIGYGANPAGKLHVNLTGTANLAAADITNMTAFGASSRMGFSGLANNSDGIYFGMGIDGGINAGMGFFREAAGWNSALTFYTNNATDGVNVSRMQEKMRINSNGNVGIGTTSPTGKLHISLQNSDSATTGINVISNASVYPGTQNFIAGKFINNHFGDSWGLWVEANNGSYGACTGIYAKGSIVSATASGVHGYCEHTNPGGYGVAVGGQFVAHGNLAGGATNGTMIGVIAKCTSVATSVVGHASYGIRLETNPGPVSSYGGVYIHNGSQMFVLNSNGGISNYSGNNLNLSDQREKRNIVLAGDYLSKICAIPIKTFNYNNDAEGEQVTLGVIAQEVEPIAPELVSESEWEYGSETNADGAPISLKRTRKGIYETDMMFAIMKSVQELNAKHEALKLEFDAYKTAHP